MKKILLSIGSYLPGENGGGPVQSVKNLIESTNTYFSYYIFTSNHDFNDSKVYESIKTDEWNKIYGSKIFYSSEKKKNINLYNILKRSDFSLIFLNDLFSYDSRKILYYYKKLNLNIPIILMPRGQFNKGALNIKFLKKKVFLKYISYENILKKIHFLSTSEEESTQISKLLKTNKIYKVSNVPNIEKEITLDTKKENKLKIIFLSRITPKKNLDYALETFKNCRNNIDFYIFGTLEEDDYWEKCKAIIKTLPTNITVKYEGELSNSQVIRTMSKFDLFYFPTKSENYGHVISEALQASIPVLISDQTPWIDLSSKKLGWEFPLEDKEKFSEKLDELASLSSEEFNDMKKLIYNTYDIKAQAKTTIENYRKIFCDIISYGS